MDCFRITLFGHRDFCATRETECKLYDILKDLMIKKSCLEIYIGRNGEFDLFAASVVKRIKKELDNSSFRLLTKSPRRMFWALLSYFTGQTKCGII